MPENPLIYHIAHYDRLSSILADGKLLSDYNISQRHDDGVGTKIGMSHIKERRLSLPVGSPSRGAVGQFVPFYFCPRSVMLYLIFRANHADLHYRGGQESIIHLVANFNRVTAWARDNEHLWAFTPSNAGARYAEFYFTKEDLSRLDWSAIANDDFSQREVKEAKQAEFLLKNDFPWSLIDEIGVYDERIKAQVESILADATHVPVVSVRREWYY